MERVIIIHHLQRMWDDGLRKVGGACFEDMLEGVCSHLERVSYDRVIMTNFEAGVYLDDDQLPLSTFSPEVYDYMYGWEREEVESWDIEWCDGGSHSEVVLVYDWMKDLVGSEVYLCGAFDGECIEDMEIALRDGVGIDNVVRVEELII